MTSDELLNIEWLVFSILYDLDYNESIKNLYNIYK